MEQLTRREQNKINCRRRILKASRRLFSTKGYEETMIEDIAQRAEVSKATVYNYFASKEALLIGTAQEVIDRVRRHVRVGLKDCRNSEEKLRRVLEEFVQAGMDYTGLSRRITYLNSCEDSALFDVRRGMTDLLYELAAAAQAEGVLRQDAKTGDIVDLVMGVFLITQFQWADVEAYAQEQLYEKVNRCLDAALHSYYVKPIA